MILTLQRFLLVFLGLLQLVAPLVHAHSHQDFPQFGLHLPTLEIYSVTHTEPSSVMQQNAALFGNDETVVGVSTGIKDSFSISCDVLTYFVLPLFFIFAVELTTALINFSPPPVVKAKKIILSLCAPRAPPVLFLS